MLFIWALPWSIGSRHGLEIKAFRVRLLVGALGFEPLFAK